MASILRHFRTGRLTKLSRELVNSRDVRPTAIIGVIGSDSHPGEVISEHALHVAEDIGRRVAMRGALLVTGGSGGIMEAVSKGAYDAGGVVIGFLPGRTREGANRYVTIPLCTGL